MFLECYLYTHIYFLFRKSIDVLIMFLFRIAVSYSLSSFLLNLLYTVTGHPPGMPRF